MSGVGGANQNGDVFFHISLRYNLGDIYSIITVMW